LIINEILTNALKHAFPEDKTGKISIDLKRSSETSCKLSISDNGNGFDHRELEKSNSLGMMIMENLSEQLEGKIDVHSSSAGTRYELEFSH
jgi:two-component sensor histidine kinase